MKVLSRPSEFKGEFYTEETVRRIYATDASAYREVPAAVALPKDTEDIISLVKYATTNGKSIIPRAAGTSLAGQVVGGGIVMDVSKHLNKILEVNPEEGWVRVQPGVIRDDLNKHLKSYGFFFAPETSTANRAMIGGMIGNNSCGSNSVVYGSTREHLLEVKTVLSDGNTAWFCPLDQNAFVARCNGFNTSSDLHTQIYLDVKEILSNQENRTAIEKDYPKADIPRRNTGYALDMLLRQQPFTSDGEWFNMASLIAGSEGTLAVITEAKLKLTPLPPDYKSLVCIHCNSIDESLHANLVALKYAPTACELMDHYILEATERNRMYQQYRFFVEGSPKALLVIEINKSSQKEVDDSVESMINELKKKHLGFAYPVIMGDDINKVWGLRKAGLGLLSNIPGDAKPAPVIEDTAVDVKELPAYISEFNQILEKHGLYSVHYAHAGSGELHLRPILNLKTEEGIRQFRIIAQEIATLVKKYNGSLSGEHGDGRLRGEFIPQMLGAHNYELCKRIKKSWDPENIFNPGKIVDSPPMDTSLRYIAGQQTQEIDTVFDFSESEGFIRATELCNGSGDCRKSELSGGTMCPSYMATRDEKDTTRARANILREMLTKSSNNSNLFESQEIKEVMDLCLSCKGCKSECPSNVDIARLKAEWQYQYYQTKGIPLRTRLIGNFSSMMQIASVVPWAYKLTFATPLIRSIAKSVVGFAPDRSMPVLEPFSLKRQKEKIAISEKKIYLFIDEFTKYNDGSIGEKAIVLLEKLGYEVVLTNHQESGRTYLSKGLLNEARQKAKFNVNHFSPLISKSTPLIGIEPSAILTFRDEYIALLRDDEQQKARDLSKHVFTFEEFLSQEIDAGNIQQDLFSKEEKLIKVHGHCHQKSLSSMTPTKKILSFLPGRKVQMIPSGCCGMAGSFGYEKEHFEVSMKIGELVLFPTVRSLDEDTIIAAAGTSCRHQIKDGTNRKSYHPIEIMHDALL